MEYRIEKATNKDIGEIESLYNAVCKSLESGENYPGWKVGIYPTRQEADNGLAEDSLFILRYKEAIAGTMILNTTYEDGYNQGRWSNDVEPQNILVIHTLAIHPDFAGHGLAGKMVDYAKSYGKQTGKKVIRIDVTDGNLPAMALYKKHGFKEAGKVDLNRAEHGLPWFLLYEFLLD